MSEALETGLSLGSNLGDRLRHLADARDRIAALPGVRLLAQSPVYETEPVDVLPRYAGLPFLNAVLILASPLEPHALAAELRRIEADAGRMRAADRNAPRPIDLDVLYAGAGVVHDGELDLPHPRWSGRRFVVQPLADVRPELRLPGEPRTVREVLLTLPPTPKVVLFRLAW